MTSHSCHAFGLTLQHLHFGHQLFTKTYWWCRVKWCIQVRCKTYRLNKNRRWGWLSKYRCPINEILSSIQDVLCCMPIIYGL
jgi:hypothetical protein